MVTRIFEELWHFTTRKNGAILRGNLYAAQCALVGW